MLRLTYIWHALQSSFNIYTQIFYVLSSESALKYFINETKIPDKGAKILHKHVPPKKRLTYVCICVCMYDQKLIIKYKCCKECRKWHPVEYISWMITNFDISL